MNRANQYHNLHTLHLNLELIEQVLKAKLAKGEFNLSDSAATGIIVLAQQAVEIAEKFQKSNKVLDFPEIRATEAA